RWSPTVTVLMPAALVVERASRSAGKLNPAVSARAPGAGRGLFCVCRTCTRFSVGTYAVRIAQRPQLFFPALHLFRPGLNVGGKISYHATIYHHVTRGRTEETMAQRMILAVLLMTPISFFGQGLGRIAGTVADPSGALVPGVKITATEVGTNVSRSALSDEQ